MLQVRRYGTEESAPPSAAVFAPTRLLSPREAEQHDEGPDLVGVTRIPSFASAQAMFIDKAFSAAFEDMYGASNGMPTREEMEEMLTIRPRPALRMSGSAARVPRTTLMTSA